MESLIEAPTPTTKFNIQKHIVDEKESSNKVVFVRNNTSFPLKLFEYLKKLDFQSDEKSKYEFLRYNQNIVREFVGSVDLNTRGLLVAHEMGLGKTMVGVCIAFDLREQNKRQTIFLVTKSLEGNIKKEIKEYILLRAKYDDNWKIPDNIDDFIDQNFSFVSMNASNMMKQMVRSAEGVTGKEYSKALGKLDLLEQRIEVIINSGSLDDKLLIVDEAHNLFRAITNGSSNALNLYNMINKARNLKLIFLTGTPISNDPFEAVVCFNMLAGPPALFPEDWSEFHKLYVDEAKGTIKNREKFQNRIMGLVSRVTVKSRPGASKGPVLKAASDAEFPTVFDRKVEIVHMDAHQYAAYMLAREREMEEGKRVWKSGSTPVLQKPKNQASSSYRQQSRQLSNYSPPRKFREGKFSNIDVNAIPNEDVNSPKLQRMLEIVEAEEGNGYIYSQFVGAGGLGIIMRFLTLHGWSLCDLQTPAGVQKQLDAADNEENSDDGEPIVKDQAKGSHQTKKTANEKLNNIVEKIKKGIKNGGSDWLEGETSNIFKQIYKEIDNDVSGGLISGGAPNGGATTQSATSSPTVDSNIIWLSDQPILLEQFHDAYLKDKGCNMPDIPFDSNLSFAYVEAGIIKGGMLAKAAGKKLNITLWLQCKEKNIAKIINKQVVQLMKEKEFDQLGFRNNVKDKPLIDLILKSGATDTTKNSGNVDMTIIEFANRAPSTPYVLDDVTGKIMKEILAKCDINKDKLSKYINWGGFIVIGNTRSSYALTSCLFGEPFIEEICAINSEDYRVLYKEAVDKIYKDNPQLKGHLLRQNKLFSGVVAATNQEVVWCRTGNINVWSKIGGYDQVGNSDFDSQALNKVIVDANVSWPKIKFSAAEDSLSETLLEIKPTSIEILKLEYSQNAIEVIKQLGVDNKKPINMCVNRELTSLRDNLIAAGFVIGRDSTYNMFIMEYRLPTTGSSTKKTRKFAIISGAIEPELRNKIVATINSAENINGGIIDLLLISSTGAEGLDLKNMRYCISFEPYWVSSRINQVERRGARGDSHKALPADKKNFQPYLLLAARPEAETKEKVDFSDLTKLAQVHRTTDIELYIDSTTDEKLIKSFEDAIYSTSIECLLNDEEGCRVCNPSNEPLFTTDFAKDINLSDKCTLLVEKQIKADSVVVDGVTYYYNKNSEKLWGWQIYEFDANFNSYVEMPEDSPQYEKIVAVLDGEDITKNLF